MLLEARRLPDRVREVPIRKVYFENNAESHFRPFKDSLRNHLALIRAILHQP